MKKLLPQIKAEAAWSLNCDVLPGPVARLLGVAFLHELDEIVHSL